MFEANCPQKHLKITEASESNISIRNHHFNLMSLQTVLKGLLTLPIGKLKKCQVEDFVILMWDFKECTPCRQASSDHFGGIHHLQRYFTIENAILTGKGNIAMPFFTYDPYKKPDNQNI